MTSAEAEGLVPAEGQVWRQGNDLVDEKWLVIVNTSGHAAGQPEQFDVIVIAPGNRVADTVERSVLNTDEIRAEWELFSE